MKCPTCGTENKSTNKACYRCGRILQDSGFQPMGDASALWRSKPADKKNVRTPPPFWGDTKGRPTYEDQNDFIVLHDEESRDNAAQDLVDGGAPVPDNRQKLERVKGKREVRVIVPSKPAPFVAPPKPRRYRVKWRRLAVSAVLILVLCAGVTYGGYSLYKLLVGSVSQLMAENRGNAASPDPLVKKVLIDGETWHRITFYGQDGDMVLVTDPKRQLQVQNGKAELLLEDQSYITSDLKEDKVTVSLEAIIVAKDGKEKKITIPPYVIEVPLSPLKLVTPQEASFTTNSDSLYVKVKVTPGSKRVLIGDKNVTDNVSKDGYASATVNLSPNSINTIQIVVETPKYRRNTFELKVDCPIMDVPIQLDTNDQTANKTSTDDKTVVIKGSVEQGATITTTAKLSGEIKRDGSSFSFTAVLKRWGWNDIEITAESGGRKSTLVHRVNHTPSLDSYSRAAMKVDDYGYLVSAAENLVGNIYQLNGVVVQKYENDAFDYYQFNFGTPSDPKLVVVENLKTDSLKLNQFYQLFADVTGVYEGYPVLTIRYMNELPMPAEFATATPGEASPSPAPEGTATQENTASPGGTATPQP